MKKLTKTLGALLTASALTIIGCEKTQEPKYPYELEKKPVVVTKIDKNHIFSAGDVDNDGLVDIITVNPPNGEVFLYHNVKGKYFQSVEPIAKIPVNSVHIKSIALGDYDSDGKLDFYVSYNNENRVIVYRNVSQTGADFLREIKLEPLVLKAEKEDLSQALRDENNQGEK